jgi:hypothetical protein
MTDRTKAMDVLIADDADLCVVPHQLWKACYSVDGDQFAVYPDTGKMEFPVAVKPQFVRGDVWEANAKLIVERHNNFTRLTTALTDAEAKLAKAREEVENLDMAIDLIQEAKGYEGCNGGPITDHLDAAEGWLDKTRACLAELGEG